MNILEKYGLKIIFLLFLIFSYSITAQTKTLLILGDSISGDTTIGGLSRIESDLLEHKPNYVLIELGGNDALRGYPVEKIKSNLLKIIDTSFAAEANPIIMQIRIPPNYGKNYVAAFEGIYSEIAEEKNIPKMTFLLEKVALDKSLMQLDGIHPNQKAQKIIAEQVRKELLGIFK